MKFRDLVDVIWIAFFEALSDDSESRLIFICANAGVDDVREFNNSGWEVISTVSHSCEDEMKRNKQVETTREDLTMILGPNSMGASLYPSLIDFDCLDRSSCGSNSTAPAFVSSKLTRLCARVDRPLPVYPLVVPPPSGCHQRPTTSKSAGLGSRMRYLGDLVPG